MGKKYYAASPGEIKGGSAFESGGSVLNNALSKFQRPQYGFDPSLRQSYLGGLRRQAGIAEHSFVNRAGATLPRNSAALLNRFRQGARLGGEIYQQGALPFALQEAQFGEGQRQADIANALGFFRTQEERDRYLRGLMAQKYAVDKSSEFNFGDFLGNVLGAGSQVGAAALIR